MTYPLRHRVTAFHVLSSLGNDRMTPTDLKHLMTKRLQQFHTQRIVSHAENQQLFGEHITTAKTRYSLAIPFWSIQTGEAK